MQCSNCGKDIPFAGNVCPHCHADKSGDQTIKVLALITGSIGAFIGNAIGDFGGVFIGAFIGAIPGFILGSILKAQKEKATGGVPTLPNTAATLRQVGVAPPPVLPSKAHPHPNSKYAPTVVGQSKRTPPTPQLEECANCGRTIGKLETPMVWNNNVVCNACYRTLRDG